nr:MAG TPA: hypothetical protein [Caudoviricetes sp.]
MSFLEYLNDELFSQDWLELFEAYNDRNKYGFLIFSSFDQLLDEHYPDRESLKIALSQGVFDTIDRDAWLYVVIELNEKLPEGRQVRLNVLGLYSDFYFAIYVMDTCRKVDFLDLAEKRRILND